MMRPSAYILPLAECHDLTLVGGKAANLGRMIRGGFRVPDGFAITTEAFAAWRQGEESAGMPLVMSREICDAYERLGGGRVAVRSSGTAEDMGSASMAGQYESYLDVNGEEELVEAVQKCWASAASVRSRAYLEEKGINSASAMMAVVVQRLVRAEVSGVLFTANPIGDRQQEMLLEASWGLGEVVVSGDVQPDVVRIDSETGRVIETVIGDKRLQHVAGSKEPIHVEERRRHEACLKSGDVDGLWQLGRRVAEHFGGAQDIEWAIESGEIYLLQTRPITTSRDARARDTVLNKVRGELRQATAMGEGPWVVHNLAETLPHPRPLTWSVIEAFMAGGGGYGAMYRKAGFEPSERMKKEGFLRLVAGRIYMDFRRAPEMFFADFPYEYDVGLLKRNPGASQAAPTVASGGVIRRIKAGWKVRAAGRRLKELSRGMDEVLRSELYPKVKQYVREEKKRDLMSMRSEKLIDLWQERKRRVLDEFAPDTLIGSLIYGMALEELEKFIRELDWEADGAAMALRQSSAGEASSTLIADAHLHEVGSGKRSVETWIAEHGHRAPMEFDLSAPRWREKPEALHEMARQLGQGASPMGRHEASRRAAGAELDAFAVKLRVADREELRRRVKTAQKYAAYRENGKDCFMLGYDLLRDVAVEVGRRLEIEGGVFYLSEGEMLDALKTGSAPVGLIKERNALHEAHSRVALPAFIDGGMLERLGEPAWEGGEASGGHHVSVISTGVASGPARVLASPDGGAGLGHGYILVCQSTDPSWTPLFINAAGLIIERGGALSHGAVVARELGLPAVVMPDATRIIKDGACVRVDAIHGTVSLCGEGEEATPLAQRDEGGVIPKDLMPPVRSRTEKRAAKAAIIGVVVWAVFLWVFFWLPAAWLRWPIIAGMDYFLWPIVRSVGKPATVVVIAAAVALSTLVVQKLVTDNRRLWEAKRRGQALGRKAEALDAQAPERRVLLEAATAAQLRIAGAGLAPVGILLGLLVLPFVWMDARVGEAARSPAAGADVQVVVRMASDWDEPVSIHLPEGLTLDEASSVSATMPPIRKTLERLLALYQRTEANAAQTPWEVEAAGEASSQAAMDDLRDYLSAGIPAQELVWVVHTQVGLDDRFTVEVSTPGHKPVAITGAVGERYPPGAASVAGEEESPIKEVQLGYSRPRREEGFWRPFKFLGGKSGWIGWLTGLDIGWVWLYVAVYLPCVLILRRVLGIA